MLYPRENDARAIIDLSGIWNFKLGDTAEPGAHLEIPTDMEPIAVPASYNDQKDVPQYRNHYGFAYYEKTFTVPRFFDGQRLVLRMDAVTHSAKVYLNGKLVKTHQGGFLPFEVELDGLVTAGEQAQLVIAVDNRIDNHTLPIGNEDMAFFGSDNAGVPSVEAAKRWRKKQNLPAFDFFNYAGLTRPVRIYTTPQSYIEDVTIVTDIDGTDGVVRYEIATGGAATEETVTVEIVDAQGQICVSAEGSKGVLRVPEARLWNPYPGEPYLYTMRVHFGGDLYEQTFGIRTVEVRGTQFLINGEPFYFKGFGKHEDSAFHGRGLDQCLNVKDVNLIHWLHANSFRTSHYPYAEEMYELCDREGIVIIDETPAVGINAGGAKNPYEYPILEHHRQVLKDLVARDKNHPCVVMWSLGNEPDTEHFSQAAYDYWHGLYTYTHELDPSDRPVTMVCCQNNYEDDIVTRTMDVVCINRYYGWYNLSGDLDAACYGLNIELDFWEQQGKPVMITEYGADAVAGIHACVPEMFSEEYQVEFYRRQNAEFDKRSFFIGEQVWNFADFATIQGVMRVDGNRKGLLTRDRRPKLAAHYFRQRWASIENFGYK